MATAAAGAWGTGPGRGLRPREAAGGPGASPRRPRGPGFLEASLGRWPGVPDAAGGGAVALCVVCTGGFPADGLGAVSPRGLFGSGQLLVLGGQRVSSEPRSRRHSAWGPEGGAAPGFSLGLWRGRGVGLVRGGGQSCSLGWRRGVELALWTGPWEGAAQPAASASRQPPGHSAREHHFTAPRFPLLVPFRLLPRWVSSVHFPFPSVCGHRDEHLLSGMTGLFQPDKFPTTTTVRAWGPVPRGPDL